ncbi:MAG: serine hydrolase family protein [Candidatus Yanofskybacteria bacterium]|nr:serine hydrolase family protein [Candidatus Yanofskybacteria bacterium]
MNKKVYIIHGWDGSPNEPMLQWLKISLEEKGYEVFVPEMPEPAVPKIESWVGKLKEVILLNEETVFIGHSIGCQAILRYLETLNENIRIAGAVLIAPWMELDKQTEEGQEVVEIAKPWMETPINFQKVKSHLGKVVAIFSDNDPFVPLSQKDLFEKELGAEIIIESGKGHFTVGDGIDKLPSALKAATQV